MRVLLLILAVLGYSTQSVTEATLRSLLDFLNIKVSTYDSKSSPSEITEEEFLRNIFLSATIQPSLFTTSFSLACLIASIKLQNFKIGTIPLNYPPLGFSANFTNVVMTSFECEDQDLSGIIPVNNRSADLVLPKINAQFTFNYSIDFGHDRPESGHGSVTLNQMAWQARFETYQGEVEHKPEGPVKATLHSNSFNFTKIDGEFSDIYTQTEWDVLFEKPEVLKKTIQYLIGTLIKKLINGWDLRKLINFTYGRGVNLLFGITTPVIYEPASLPAPDNSTMEFKLHTIVTMPQGEHVEGLFPVNMQAKPLSNKYTSLIFNTDALNRILSATTRTESLSISFNQRNLDLLKFKLLELNTTALKPFFPSLEPIYGPNLGVYMRAYLPQYDDNRCYIKVSGGIIVAVLAVQLELYVTKDQSTYYNSTLAQCLANANCTKANSIEIDLYVKLPLTFTKDKMLAVGFMDVEVTNVVVTPSTFDPEPLRVKLNNFVDISLPHLIPPIDISMVLAPFLVSVDALEDQRVALAVAVDQ